MTNEHLISALYIVVAVLVFFLLLDGVKARKIREKKERYKQGYAYAAVELLRNTSTVDQLLARANEFDSNEFDQGIKDAVHAFITIKGKSNESAD
jgi:hypothetical protein